MIVTIKVPHQLATYAEQQKADRTHRIVGSKLKKSQTELVALYSKGARKVLLPVLVEFHWHYSGKFDLDNIAFAKKYALDGLVIAGTLREDNPKCVLGFSDHFYKVKKGGEALVMHLVEYEE